MAAKKARSAGAAKPAKKKPAKPAAAKPGKATKPSKVAASKAAKPSKVAGKPAKPAKAPAKAAAKPKVKAGAASKPAARPAKAAKASLEKASRVDKSAKVEASKVEKAPKGAKLERAAKLEAPKGGKGDKAVAKAAKGKEKAPKPPPLLRKPPTAPPREAPEPPRERVGTLPLPLLAPSKRATLEERARRVEEQLSRLGEARAEHERLVDKAWIFHDSALEGMVYTPEELGAALSGAQPSPDSSLQPTYDEIRRHREAIEFVRDFATKKRLPLTVDVLKKIYLILHPEEGDIKAVKYRKDIPQHRLYFHEYAAPDKIAHKVRQVVDWVNDPETRKTRSVVRIAARAHYDLLRVYPFPTDSGKVARLLMNLLLLRAGLPPALVHSSERQRYYDALKGSANVILQMVQEAVENALLSIEKRLEEDQTRVRGLA